MAQTVLLKRSAVQNNIPTTSTLALGELAINTYDGKIFIRKDNGVASIVELSSSSNISYTPTGNISSTTVQTAINELDTEKQATLVSGTNIRTINGNSLLGSTDLSISGTVSVTDDTTTNATYYPVLGTSATGSLNARASSTKLTYNPSTGALAATSMNVTTPTAGDNSTQVATTAFVATAMASGGAVGGGTDQVFNENSYVITTDYTIPAGKSAITVGDNNGNVTINSGVTVTLSANSRWVVL
jgi:hypothetical protein